jgi:phosphate transport system permease protein
MGIMILPLVSSLSEDAMRGVPRGLREGSCASAPRDADEPARRVPAAFSGTSRGILAVSRAIGETMIVAMPPGSSRD